MNFTVLYPFLNEKRALENQVPTLLEFFLSKIVNDKWYFTSIFQANSTKS